MIPSTAGFLEENFDFEEQPTHTYKMNLQSGSVRGYSDGQAAMAQAIYKILSTERYQYIMYSGNYGIETLDLFGQPVSYVCPELERRITEALLWDSRILSVENFDFEILRKGEICVSFTAKTIFGDVDAEKAVKI